MNVVDYELMDHEEIMQFHVALARLEEMTGVEHESAMKKVAIVVAIAAAFLGGYGYGRWHGKPRDAASGGRLYWVDPMHPWYKSDKPGIAPDCGMKLVPVYAGDEAKNRRRRTAAGHGRDSAGEAAAHRRRVRHGGIPRHRPLRFAPPRG